VLYKDAELVFRVSHVKCDTEEGDLLSGKFLSRTRNVKQVCRCCHCPMDEADNPQAKYKLKTQANIQNLVERGKLEQLRAISQQYINNAWYKVKFHEANEMGIHGACPSDKLHAVLLGIFKYIRGIFFSYMGKTSQLARDINGIAKMYGTFFTHQSERRLPVTSFTQGIAKGKLMATHYRGVLLIMAAVLRSTMGRKLLMKKKSFGKVEGLRDWSMLVEQLLEWEAYLCLTKMRKQDVKKLARKHRFIMYLMKNVAQRKEGMGLKLMKFHAIIHMVQDMLLFGVPYEFDTGACESHHKPTKAAAKMTQRKESTFNYQCAQRMTEFLALDLAMAEIDQNRRVWHYFHCDYTHQMDGEDQDDEDLVGQDGDSADDLVGDLLNLSMEAEDSDEEMDVGDGEGSAEDTESVEEEPQQQPLGARHVRTWGTKIEIYEDENDNWEPNFRILGRSKSSKKSKWSSEVVHFLYDLQNKVRDHLPNGFLQIYTEHQRDQYTFRAHPNFRGQGPWKDWAMVNWGPYEGVLPCHIWCFVKLKKLPVRGAKFNHGGVDLKNGVYAVVECAQYVEDVNQIVESDLFTPLELIVQGLDPKDGEVTGRQFFLAEVEAFTGPCCVVPDIGGAANGYFLVKNRDEWAEVFHSWLKSPHNQDEMVLTDDEEE
jgi:hypothetical protein